MRRRRGGTRTIGRPRIAAAVTLAADVIIDGLADSKTLTARKREALAAEIKASATAWSVASATAEEIDALNNILRASLLAMRRAVDGLAIAPREVLVDGLYCPEVACLVRAVVGGDVKPASAPGLCDDD